MSTYRNECPQCGDAYETNSWEPVECPFCNVNKLERELAEQCRLNGMGAEREAKLMAQLAEAKRELDNAESDKRQADTDTIRALRERNEARQQRDRLADALREIIDLSTQIPDPTREAEIAREAIAAVEGNP